MSTPDRDLVDMTGPGAPVRRCGRWRSTGGACRQVLAPGQDACRYHDSPRRAAVPHSPRCGASTAPGWGILLEAECMGAIHLEHWVCVDCGAHSVWAQVM